MTLERTLQVTLATLLTLGTLLLGIGQANLLLPLLAAIAAGGSVWLTDVTGRVRLKQNVATLAAVGTLGIFALDLFRLGRESQLVAIANLLVYLQVVLLFQKKDLRIYWQLLMLSLLQVVVAAALSLSPWFGPLVLLYLFLGLLSLSLFFALRESLRFQPAVANGLRSGSGEEASVAAPAIAGFSPVSREDLTRGGISRDLARHVATISVLTLLLSTAIFFVIPRFQKSPLISQTLSSQTIIGYNESVELGRLGEALQDRSSVMRVWFSDSNTGAPYPVAEEPLFRGAVLDTYQGKQWSYFVDSGRQFGEPRELHDVRIGESHVLERIALEEQRESTAFSVLPAFRIDSNCPLEEEPRRQQLIRKTRRGRIEFTLATTGLEEGRQVDIVPASRPMGRREKQRLLALPETDAQGNDPLRRLKQVAGSAVQGAPESDPIRRAKALEAALAPGNGFEYSLESVPRDPALDPVEDFVSTNKRGHCEYFASALTLMLRSQGIPARMAIGFKGGEFNSLGSYYQVRMLHAHTWVEAYIEPGQLPAAFRHRSQGGWLTLDPTPGSDDSAEGRSLSLAGRAREWMDFGDYLWMNYVVGLDSRRQREAIFEPLSIGGYSLSDLFSKQTWTKTIPDFFKSLKHAETWRRLFKRLLGWPLWIILGALLTGAGWRGRRWIHRMGGKVWRLAPLRAGLSAARQRKQAVRVPFYERLEELLAGHGMRRPASQTPHEFAMAVGGQLSETPQRALAAPLPRRVVDAFYRVRFGRHALDKSETEAVERSLLELEAALAR
jgi:transglutaminase-like putative cysteine protease